MFNWPISFCITSAIIKYITVNIQKYFTITQCSTTINALISYTVKSYSLITKQICCYCTTTIPKRQLQLKRIMTVKICHSPLMNIPTTLLGCRVTKSCHVSKTADKYETTIAGDCVSEVLVKISRRQPSLNPPRWWFGRSLNIAPIAGQTEGALLNLPTLICINFREEEKPLKHGRYKQRVLSR